MPSSELIKEGSIVRLKSGTEGWVKGQIVEYTDLISYPALGAAIYTGPGYKVYVLEGKHKGETIRVPANYVESYTGPAPARKEPLYPHVPRRKEPLFPHVAKGRQVEHLPQTIEGGEPVPPQYHDLIHFINEPLPKEAE